jgi:hypothetical protein
MDTDTIEDSSTEEIEKDFDATEKNGIVLWVLLVSFCLIFVFASVDLYRSTDLTMSLNKLFIAGSTKAGISVLDGVVILLSLALMSQYGVDFRSARSILKVIFVSAVICWLLNLLNPNDRSPDKLLGLPVFAEFGAYPYLLFMFTVFFMNGSAFTVFARRVFLVSSGCLVLRAVILLVLWAQGAGNRAFFGINSVLTEGDSLFIFAFFQSVFFALFLLNHKKTALIAWLLTVAIQVFSYRRSGLFQGMIVNAGTLTLHILFSPNRRSRLRGAVAGALIVLVGYAVTTSLVSPEVVDNYLARYLGIFTESSTTPSASDSGHLDETKTTMLYAVQRMEFWGFGYGDPSRVSIPGATQRQYIHNVYAAVWWHHGMYMFLFFLMLLVTGVISLVVVLMQRLRHDWPVVLLTATFLLYFVSLTISWLFDPIAMAEALRMRLMWVFILAFAFKLTNDNYRRLFSGTVEIDPTG